MIEHSYKADSDLSPAGWEYAERLKAAVTARRKAARTERAGHSEVVQEENPLIVRFNTYFTRRKDRTLMIGLDIST